MRLILKIVYENVDQEWLDWWLKNYGHHTASEIKNLVSGAAKEAHRISKQNAFMAFKWNDHDLKLQSVLKLMEQYWEPLFGQTTSVRTMRASTTYWVMLKRTNPNQRR